MLCGHAAPCHTFEETSVAMTLCQLIYYVGYSVSKYILYKSHDVL